MVAEEYALSECIIKIHLMIIWVTLNMDEKIRIREAIKQTSLTIEETDNPNAIPALEEGLSRLEESLEHLEATKDE